MLQNFDTSGLIVTVKKCHIFWTTSTIKLLKQFGIGEEGEEGVAGGGGGATNAETEKKMHLKSKMRGYFMLIS